MLRNNDYKKDADLMFSLFRFLQSSQEALVICTFKAFFFFVEKSSDHFSHLYLISP